MLIVALSSNNDDFIKKIFIYEACFLGGIGNHQITSPPAQGGVEGCVRLLLTNTRSVPSVIPCQRSGILFEWFPRPRGPAEGSIPRVNNLSLVVFLRTLRPDVANQSHTL